MSPWGPQQRAWLQAMGYAVYRAGHEAEAGAEEAPGPEAGGPPSAGAPAPADVARPGAVAPAPAHDRPRPVRAPPPASDAGPGGSASPRPAMRRPARLPDRLQLALLRASGLDPSDPAAQAAMAQWPVERLRGDAAAKRAFWPQLRALRRRP